MWTRHMLADSSGSTSYHFRVSELIQHMGNETIRMGKVCCRKQSCHHRKHCYKNRKLVRGFARSIKVTKKLLQLLSQLAMTFLLFIFYCLVSLLAQMPLVIMSSIHRRLVVSMATIFFLIVPYKQWLEFSYFYSLFLMF